MKTMKGPVSHKEITDRSFPEQAKFVSDTSQTIVAICTRRAGKSNGLGQRLFRAALRYPGSTPLYIALTRDSAKNIMWPALKEINKKHGIGAEFIDSNLTVSLSNGSNIRLVGADMKNFIERLRGPKYPEVCIDEAGSFRSHLQSLIEDILEPATLDYNGSIVLAGTPGIIPQGVFFDLSQGIGHAAKHSWSLFNNPYLKDAYGFVKRLKEKRNWTEANPTLRREYYGEWVIDMDALVYRFNREKNGYLSLPVGGHKWERILSVDYGYNDKTAFAVAAYSLTYRKVFIEYSFGQSEMIPSEIAEHLQMLRDRYKPEKIIADTGGLGKSITEEFIKRYHIPIEAAEKRDKLSHMALMNGDFIDGNLFVHDSLKDLQDQYLTLTKGDDGLEDQTMPNDLCDAALYAYYKAKHYLGVIAVEPPKENTPAWFKLEEEKMIEELEREVIKPKQEWWEEDY